MKINHLAQYNLMDWSDFNMLVWAGKIEIKAFNFPLLYKRKHSSLIKFPSHIYSFSTVCFASLSLLTPLAITIKRIVRRRLKKSTLLSSLPTQNAPLSNDQRTWSRANTQSPARSWALEFISSQAKAGGTIHPDNKHVLNCQQKKVRARVSCVRADAIS